MWDCATDRVDRRRARVCAVFALVTVAVFSGRIDAMVVVPAEFSEMATASQAIVHGRVVDVRSYETAGRRTIESLVTLEVIDQIKGQRGTTAYFRLPGGQVGRYRRVMVGAPQCARGDEVVVFLKGVAPVLPMPYGLTQGLYRVGRDGSGRATVIPLVNVGAERAVRGDPARRPLELAAFTAFIRDVVGSQR